MSASIIDFFLSVGYWHMHPDQYYIDIAIVDIFFVFLAWFLFHFVYRVFRKRMHIKDLRGGDRIIGYMCSAKKWESGPNGEVCMYKIKYRRCGWYFIKDLIHRSRLYYLPPQDIKKHFDKRMRDVWIVGRNVVWREHPASVIENYYYLGPGNVFKGEYESMGDYLGMGKSYLKLMAETCQTAIQSDPELTAERYQLDTVPLPLVSSHLNIDYEKKEKLTHDL